MIKNLIIKLTSDKKLLKDIIIGVLAVLFILTIVFGAQYIKNDNLSPDEVTTKAMNFINSELLNGQATATFESITNDKGLYKIKFNINGKSIESYVTKDGSLFFPEGYTIGTSSAAVSQTSNTVTKSDKPKVELFVMSYCPYGTQIEKGIIPTVEALGDKIDFSLKFVNYAMHGQKEITENLRQYCIDKEQNAKLLPYLSCFLKNDNSASCLQTVGVNQVQMNSCVNTTDQQFKITEQFTNKQNWKGSYPPFGVHGVDNDKYGVQGSPTLVINGAKAESARSSDSLLKTICSSFNNQPEICSTAKLSTSTPAPGFGEETQASDSASADCTTN